MGLAVKCWDHHSESGSPYEDYKATIIELSIHLVLETAPGKVVKTHMYQSINELTEFLLTC